MLDQAVLNERMLKSMPLESLTLINKGERVYNPATGEYEETSTEEVVNGFIGTFTTQEIAESNNLLYSTDRKVLVLGFKHADKIKIYGKEYRVQLTFPARGYTKFVIRDD